MIEYSLRSYSACYHPLAAIDEMSRPEIGLQ